MKEDGIVRIFMLPLQYPCGPQSSCCGPIGQSEEQVKAIKEAVEKIGYSVEVKNVALANDMKEYPTILTLSQTIGVQALPIVTKGEDIVSMGTPNPQYIIKVLRGK